MAPLIIPALCGGSVVRFTRRPLYLGKRVPVTHWKGGLVIPIAGQSALEKTISCMCRKSNPASSSSISWPTQYTDRVIPIYSVLDLMFFWPCIMNWLYINYQLWCTDYYLFIKYYSPLHVSSLKCSSSGGYSCTHAAYWTVTLWEFLVACRCTAWVRTDCRGKVVGRAS